MIKANDDPNKKGKYKHAKVGTFYPQNPEKYIGKELPIFKSSLERRMMRYLDTNPSIIKWKYEPIFIKYIDKTEGNRVRKYFIDFSATIKCGKVAIKKVWIEVKPLSETIKPKNPKSVKANTLWVRNNCKWDAARKIAAMKGYGFHIITEEQLSPTEN